MTGQESLRQKILDRGLCTACGMCVNLCPYLGAYRDRVAALHPCGLADGACWHVCPRSGLDPKQMDLSVFGRLREDHALGCFSAIYFSRAVSKAPGAQYGGTATALAALALEAGLVPAVAVTGGDALAPKPVLAVTREEVLAGAGSKFTAVPTLAAVNRGQKQGLTGLGLVGRPCQVAAARKMAETTVPGYESTVPPVALYLGLFCFFAFAPEFYGFLSCEAKAEWVVRSDIPPEELVVVTAAGEQRWPLAELKPLVRPGCHHCFDSTAEWADLSVGSTEYDPDWNTLVVRTVLGEKLLALALERGVLEIRPYPPERLPLLRRAALGKKQRVLAGDRELSGLALDFEYEAAVLRQQGGASGDGNGTGR